MPNLKGQSVSNALSKLDKPKRPTLTLFFYVFVSVFAGSKALFLTGNLTFVLSSIILILAALVLFCFVFQRIAMVKTLVFLALCATLSSALAACALANLYSAKDLLNNNPVSRFTYLVSQDSTNNEYGFRTKSKVFDDGKALGSVWLTGKEAFKADSELCLVGRFEPMDDSQYGENNFLQGVLGTVSVSAVTHKAEQVTWKQPLLDLKQMFLKQLPKTNGFALLKGVLLGDKADLQEKDIDAVFSAAGLAHMVAVSGAHLAIVSVFIEMIVSKAKVSKRMRWFLLLSITFIYVALCGFPISAIRAWCMNAACFCSSLLFRRNHSLTAVSAIGTALILLNPLAVSQLGFLLSVCCVISLCLFSPFATYYTKLLIPSKWIRVLPKRIRKVMYKGIEAIQQVLACSLICGLASAPLCAATFSQISIVGPISNLVVTPLFAPFMAVGALALLLQTIPVLGMLFLSLADLFGECIFGLANTFAHIPGAVIPVEITQEAAWASLTLLVGLTLLIWPLLTQKQFLCLIALAMTILSTVCIVLPAFWGPTRAVVLDIGQGDSILLQDKNHAFLIDTGPDDSALHRLKELGIFSLDGILLTHQHDDHYGGLKYFSGAFAYKDLYVANGVQEHFCKEIHNDVESQHLQVHTLEAGDSFSDGAWQFSILWPKEKVDGTENKDSICCLASLMLPDAKKDFSLLLTGDAEKDELKGYISQLKSLDVLKVGHHGSAVSLTADQAKRLHAKVAIASAGENNRYGHPKRECIEALNSAHTQFLCTKDVGSVEIDPNKDGFQVLTNKTKEVFAYD